MTTMIQTRVGMRTARAALLLACGLVQSSFVHPILAAQRPSSLWLKDSFWRAEG
jgi:hypothetical protein